MPPATLKSYFICAREGSLRSACVNQQVYQERNGRRYCVLHFPGFDKTAAFHAALKQKLDGNDSNFRGIWFPDDVSFSSCRFGLKADFSYATFNGAADFSDTRFAGQAIFKHATFRVPARFSGAQFKDRAYFLNTEFSEVSFEGARFGGEADFSHAQFANACFHRATFEANASFHKAKFLGPADFSHSTFKGIEAAQFVKTYLGELADFSNSTFRTVARFDDAKFIGGADFGVTTFCKKAYFRSCCFGIDADETSSIVADFSNSHFDEDVSFSKTKFNKPTFFSNVRFGKEAEFRDARFGANTSFTKARFTGLAGFSYTSFVARAGFSYAIFRTLAYFLEANFYGPVSFSHTTFSDHSRFQGNCFDKGSLDLQHARIERPNGVSFHMITLLPNWFVNVDARKIDFISVGWKVSISREIATIEEKGLAPAHRLLEKICQQLAMNYEENQGYEQASRFRYWAMNAQRLANWRGFAVWKLNWWYWLLSGFGEKFLRAFIVLVVVWLGFSWAYTQVPFLQREPMMATAGDMPAMPYAEAANPLSLSRALTYSLGVMSLQKPEPRPATSLATCFVTLETILGPVQAALLALAMRRNFMR